ncbi:MAG: DUF721 domain-containing protein [Acidimicrobiales bacterium]|nr:hypothetical protein [Acidimicrobiaceae bacterium]MDP6076593.1 DUF721 domain-containing protein [Acidimicrobiales bacterium]HCV35729.1 hypothetical protein [Acidimicrobiaceae bacterium]HJO80262.1 DUF721 domain-containing protein [Acidimicrobiales bacterium]
MNSESGPTPIRRSLDQLMTSLGVPEIDATVTIVEQWPEIVGPELAEGVVAVAVRGQELLVRVDDPAWASQIAWLEAQLLDRINDLVGPGKVTSVRARMARRPGL